MPTQQFLILPSEQHAMAVSLVKEAISTNKDSLPELNQLLACLQNNAKPVLGAEDAIAPMRSTLEVLVDTVKDALPYIKKMEQETDSHIQLTESLDTALSDASQVLDAWSAPHDEPAPTTPAPATPAGQHAQTDNVAPLPRRYRP